MLAPAAAELQDTLCVRRAEVDDSLDDRSAVEPLGAPRRQFDRHVEGRVPAFPEVHRADLFGPPRHDRQHAGQLRFALFDDVLDLSEPRAPRRLIVRARRGHVATAVEASAREG